MPFNGAGTFNRVYNWQDDAAHGIKIRADRMDTEMDGFATGLTDCVTRDGQSPWTANMPAGGHHITGLEDGLLAQDSATLKQVQQQTSSFAAAAGTGDAVTVGMSPVVIAYTDGMQLNIRMPAANTLAAPTINVDGLGAKTITKWGGSPISVGEYNAGFEAILRYRASANRFELCNPRGLRYLRTRTITSGSGTHTPNTDCSMQFIRGVGGGGGGGGSGAAGVNGTAGGNTSFNGVVGNGGNGGQAVAGGNGAGGTGGAGAVTHLPGGAGIPAVSTSGPSISGGSGGSTFLGGGAGSSTAAISGSGAGGGGGFITFAGYTGGGGGGAEGFIFWQVAAASPYAIGGGGSGGAGTNAGGAGANGILIIEEWG